MEAATTGQATRAGLALDAGTLTEAFQRTAGAHADAVALRTPGGEMQITWAQYGERVRDLAAGLAAHGVGTGDTVAIMLTNRPETVLVDSAAMHIGAIPFSIYNTSSPEQVEYLFSHARCSVVVTETQFASTVLDVARPRGLDRARVPRRRRDERRTDARRSRVRGRSGLRLRGCMARRPADRHRDADLHVRDHGPAEGGRAHPREPALGDTAPGPGVPDARGRAHHLLSADGPSR